VEGLLPDMLLDELWPTELTDKDELLDFHTLLALEQDWLDWLEQLALDCELLELYELLDSEDVLAMALDEFVDALLPWLLLFVEPDE